MLVVEVVEVEEVGSECPCPDAATSERWAKLSWSPKRRTMPCKCQINLGSALLSLHPAPDRTSIALHTFSLFSPVCSSSSFVAESSRNFRSSSSPSRFLCQHRVIWCPIFPQKSQRAIVIGSGRCVGITCLRIVSISPMLHLFCVL